MPEKGSEKLRHKEDADPEKTQETNRPQGPWLYLRPPAPILPASSGHLFSHPGADSDWYRASPPQEHTEAWPAHLAELAISLAAPGREHFLLYLDSCRDSDSETRMSNY